MTAATVAPPLRRLPVPVVEPEPAVGPWVPAPAPPAYAVQGTLALAFAAGGPAPLALVDPEFAPRPTPSSALPDAERSCTALVRAVVEVLAGTRPASQLVRWTTLEVHAALQQRAALAARRGRSGPPLRRQAVVRALRICEPADGVAEACAVVLDRGRVRAVALRLEGLDGRWRVSALEIG